MPARRCRPAIDANFVVSAHVHRAVCALLAIGGLAAACTEKRAAELVPVLVRVQQAQTTPSFTHAVLKVFRDEGSKPTTFLKATECIAVSALPTGQSGRHRLELAIAAGGPYFLQFTGHNDVSCSPSSAVAAALAPGIMAAGGVDGVVVISATAVDRFVTLEPPAGVLNGETVARAFHTATVLGDGTLVLAGGAQELQVLDSAACARGAARCFGINRATSGIHAFDPASGAMILVGALADRRFLHGAALAPGTGGGRLVVAGGAQSATIAGDGSGADAPFIRADSSCTNPNDAADNGCILSSIEAHALDGTAPQVGSMANGRAALAVAPLGGGKFLVAGGRVAKIQHGCTTDAQCAQNANCRADGRCTRRGQDCAEASDASQVCPAGFTCDTSEGGGRCIKRGCAQDQDCGGCLVSGGCTTGTPSTCDVATGICTKRGCQTDSECLGSNRRCLQGNCVQVACDGLVGCKAGSTCDLRSGKCRPDGVTIDCAAPGNCDCRGDADCASGFTCQTSGELAGRCRNVATGCPATVCRRDEKDPAQGPYFDPSGNLRREVNCSAGQCVQSGCRADLDCQPGFLCVNRGCEAGRRITASSDTAEVCEVSATAVVARPCRAAPALTAPREGLATGCLVRDPTGACTSTVLWGGNTGLDASAELRGASGEAAGAVTVTGCAVTGACATSMAAALEDSLGMLFVGGVGHQSGGGSQYRFLSSVYRLAPGATTARLLTTQLPAARAGAATALLPSGVVIIGGVGDGFSGSLNAGLFQADGSRYEEPEALKLTTRRFGHTATVLPDGRIVVVGGIEPMTPSVLSTAEIFTPRNALR